jgi:hypothetical protein
MTCSGIGGAGGTRLALASRVGVGDFLSMRSSHLSSGTRFFFLRASGTRLHPLSDPVAAATTIESQLGNDQS